MKSFARHILLLCAALIALPGLLTAQIPQTVALQGQLFQRNGSPLPDGNYTVTVSFHDGVDGEPIGVCNGCTVSFINGVFQVVLGGNDAPLPTMDRQYWVSVSVNGEELRPRMALHSAPYARAATEAEYAPGMVPVGALVPFAGVAIPDERFLPADGRTLNMNEYPELFAAIGTRWGSGTTEGEFALPDTRDAFIRGARADEEAITYADPIGTDDLRLDNTAEGSVYDQGVVSTNELAQQLPQVTFMYLIRVR